MSIKIPSLTWAVETVRECLTDDLRKPKYQGHPNKYRGHCYVATEALYHLVAKKLGYRPHYIKLGPEDGNETHWILIDSEGRLLDPTEDQFEEGDLHWIYAQPLHACGFLTRKPSKRAQELITRVRRHTHD